MSYTVLARRYRSQTFAELIGQEAVATTLANAITSNRVAHAYLFTGTRGVGKTSAARILAKALICEKGPTPEPCGVCSMCVDAAAGQDIDVIEIDGASNTSVDDIRNLRSNAIYRPARARYKIYIIDEVHMISTSAFNALLKTLEEPPEHVKFIFATTEPNKVPITIQSRCQRFDFRPIPKEQIASHLREILKSENVTADELIIDRVARLANGSMRDALSLIDRLLSLGHKKLTTEVVEPFLPAHGVEHLAVLADALIAGDAGSAVRQADKILGTGMSSSDFCSALTDYVRDLMVTSACSGGRELLNSPASAHDRLCAQGAKIPAIVWAYAITVMEQLARTVRSVEQSRSLIDAAIVTLSNLPRLTELAGATAPSASHAAPQVSSPAQNVAPTFAPAPSAPAMPATSAMEFAPPATTASGRPAAIGAVKKKSPPSL